MNCEHVNNRASHIAKPTRPVLLAIAFVTVPCRRRRRARHMVYCIRIDRDHINACATLTPPPPPPPPHSVYIFRFIFRDFKKKNKQYLRLYYFRAKVAFKTHTHTLRKKMR